MKIQQVVEKEVKDVSFSLDTPQNISICVTSKSDYDFLDLNLIGEDLELSIQFCEMLKRKLLENTADINEKTFRYNNYSSCFRSRWILVECKVQSYSSTVDLNRITFKINQI